MSSAIPNGMPSPQVSSVQTSRPSTANSTSTTNTTSTTTTTASTPSTVSHHSSASAGNWEGLPSTPGTQRSGATSSILRNRARNLLQRPQPDEQPDTARAAGKPLVFQTPNPHSMLMFQVVQQTAQTVGNIQSQVDNTCSQITQNMLTGQDILRD